jgi:hypothetical protein
VGVFFFDATGDCMNSDHSSFDATGMDAGSAARRGRGNGDERCPARWFLASVSPVTRSNNVLKSCTSADRRDGGSGGGLLVASCAWASAKIDNKKNTEKLAVLNTFSIFTPRARVKMVHYETTSN